jgi:hypothetical protein
VQRRPQRQIDLVSDGGRTSTTKVSRQLLPENRVPDRRE